VLGIQGYLAVGMVKAAGSKLPDSKKSTQGDLATIKPSIKTENIGLAMHRSAAAGPRTLCEPDILFLVSIKHRSISF